MSDDTQPAPSELDPFDPGEFGLSNDPDVVVELASETDTRRLGSHFARHLDTGGFIGLVGELGSGKTTFVKGLVEALSAREAVRSPTYTLLHHYETEPPTIHVDLYRLDTYDELETTGYWDFVEARGVIACVEWLDRIPGAWPGSGHVVELRHTDDRRRIGRIWLEEGSGGDFADELDEAFSDGLDG